ncbi:angiogenic factor with G patch and FHA domains 1-like isoform X2 [Dinothrombium tinctorium]|uniref:Angiogenic factor with G patch and FHA domains 1-like isoform X2 n=1 Tax=Dinothrombium tinctorium TaxID=1965070 RepID=A0A443QRL3_9ACAR|nr:angiogenic factor with G patch and FHA domains 1-like isoform X2 [Dinothrombium tinctorium]
MANGLQSTEESSVAKALKEKCDELERVRGALRKVEKELHNVKAYNEDLQNQVKLLNAKLCLHRTIDKCAKISVQTQTELYSNDDCGSNCSRPKNDWLSQSIDSKTRVAALVREVAELNSNLNDYVFDQNSNTYYSQSSGWYYYPDRKLFFDPHSKNYYQYDEKNKVFQFYAALKEGEQKVNTKRQKKKLCETVDDESEPIEEGELNSSFSSDDCIEEITLDDENSMDVHHSCIRMIVKNSTTLDEGSLLLINYMGAKIGNDEKCDVYITDDCISKLHAEVTFNKNEQTYYIKDANSEEGSYINGQKIKVNELYALKHGDTLKFGSCELLLHIHEGRDVTCIHCEPGCVQASLKSLKTFSLPVRSEYERRRNLNLIKKKYGITWSDGVFLPKNYTDRAEERRKNVGSDNPYEKTEEGTSQDKPLTHKNKGFKMMEKMGWVQGHGLGKSLSGRISPIQLEVRPEKVGLGFASIYAMNDTVDFDRTRPDVVPE